MNKRKAKKAKRVRRYLVPVLFTYVFGTEVEVEATSAREARKKALNHEGDGDGLDWDRAVIKETDIGTWQRVKEIKP